MKWLLIDTNYMCNRAFYSTGGLKNEGLMTGVVFGVLRDVIITQHKLRADRIAWFFDSKKNDRREICESYKANRRSTSTAEVSAKKELHKEIIKLRMRYLPECGFKNIFLQVGKEADDLIAAAAGDLAYKETAVIVSSDEDLYQLLSNDVSMFNPRSKVLTTRKSFIEKHQVQPEMWAHVKAIAGCTSDNIGGIYGVGEKTAIKWIRGEIEPNSDVDKKINRNLGIVNTNMKLTTLPLSGTEKIEFVDDEVTRESWQRFLRKMKFSSIMHLEPRGMIRRRHATRKK